MRSIPLLWIALTARSQTLPVTTALHAKRSNLSSDSPSWRRARPPSFCIARWRRPTHAPPPATHPRYHLVPARKHQPSLYAPTPSTSATFPSSPSSGQVPTRLAAAATGLRVMEVTLAWGSRAVGCQPRFIHTRRALAWTGVLSFFRNVDRV
nr:uncharacterized protein LOC127334709 [Lolium perenne]